MDAKEKHTINRKIKLCMATPEGETKIDPNRIKSVDVEHLEVLAPLDVSDLSTLVDQQIKIEEDPVGAPGQVYETMVVDHTIVAGEVEDRLLILKRPPQFQERRLVRVDVSFPATIKVEVQQGANAQAEPKSYEGLATNISASGMLVILGMPDEHDIEQGQTVTITFKLPVDEPLVFTLSTRSVRKYQLEFSELSTKYAIAFQFLDISPEVENHLVRYVLALQMELQSKDMDAASVPVYDQVNLLREELNRLQEQLRLSHDQIKRGEESRYRSDTIIIQLTKRLNEQEMLLRRRRWWCFWERRGRH